MWDFLGTCWEFIYAVKLEVAPFAVTFMDYGFRQDNSRIPLC